MDLILLIWINLYSEKSRFSYRRWQGEKAGIVGIAWRILISVISVISGGKGREKKQGSKGKQAG